MATTLSWNVTGYPNATPTTVENLYGDLYINPHWKQFPPIPDYWHYIVGVYITFVGITGVVGNFLVIWIFSRTKPLRTPANMFIVNLALSDLTFSAINGFPLLTFSAFNKRWMFGKAACELYGLAGGIFGLMSINTMTMIAIDRFLVIARPISVMRKMSHKRAFFMIMLIWVWSLLWATPPIFGWGAYVPEGFLTSCSYDYLTRTDHNRSFIICMYSFDFVLPVSIIFYCYTKIVKAVADHEKEMHNMAKRLNAKDIRQGDDQRTELKTAKIAFITIMLFLLSWTPYAVVALIGEFGPAQYVTPYAAEIPVMFAKASAMYNPIVYSLSHPKFRAVLNEKFPWLMICCKPKKKVRRDTTTRGDGLSRADSNTSYVPGMSEVSNISDVIEMTEEPPKPAAPAVPKNPTATPSVAAPRGAATVPQTTVPLATIPTSTAGQMQLATAAAAATSDNQLVNDLVKALAAATAQKSAAPENKPEVYAISNGHSAQDQPATGVGHENPTFQGDNRV